MKKIMLVIGIILVVISFNSCTSDDGNDNQNADKIVGAWKLSQLFINNIDQQVNECEKKMTIEVFKNGNYTEKDYEYNNVLTECVLYDLVNGTWKNLGNSMYEMSGLNTSTVKVTFNPLGFTAEYSETIEGITLTVKTVFMAIEHVVPDPIIGQWKQEQEFLNGEEVTLSSCEKMSTFEFRDDGFFLENEYEDNEAMLECVASPVKTRIWKHIDETTYMMYELDDDSGQELHITFENNKMIIELSMEEDGTIYIAKLIFAKI
ncbi:lipocalin family protein [Aestuariivivens sediminis]|uniref:lipocalin family protein n=1 Tax=Aestuariivivens sediminis TaxID=2913557 RepID=UPI001F59BBBD|nr:lipocalin family protein [Aestuariivivens sediminis]